MPNLTKKQKQILDFITQFIQTNEYAPSYREIAEYFGLSSTATIHEHVKHQRKLHVNTCLLLVLLHQHLIC